MKDSFPKLLEILAAGAETGLALATIVETGGSTPQVVGASAIFSEAGLEAGTVGGGPLEARVEAAAKDALRDGKARLMSARLDADPSDPEGAICGGAVRVLVDPGVGRDRGVFARALEGIKKRRAGYLIAEIRKAAAEFVEVERYWVPADEPAGGVPDVLRTAGEGLAAGPGRYPAWAGFGDRLAFVEFVRPLPRLIIAGAGHVGRALARLGSRLDFSVTVVDDRPEFANADRVPEADEIIVGDFGGSLAQIEPSAENYIVIVTRGHRKDAEALRAVIGRAAAYIGMIGSKAKVEAMGREFIARGWATEREWAGIHSPIGLAIGSKTVEEIAVSIAAELVLVRSRRKAEGRA